MAVNWISTYIRCEDNGWMYVTLCAVSYLCSLSPRLSHSKYIFWGESLGPRLMFVLLHVAVSWCMHHVDDKINDVGIIILYRLLLVPHTNYPWPGSWPCILRKGWSPYTSFCILSGQGQNVCVVKRLMNEMQRSQTVESLFCNVVIIQAAIWPTAKTVTTSYLGVTTLSTSTCCSQIMHNLNGQDSFNIAISTSDCNYWNMIDASWGNDSIWRAVITRSSQGHRSIIC